jgi:hypothetical protein
VGQAPGRTLCLDPVAWSGAGWPHIGVPSNGARPGPALYTRIHRKQEEDGAYGTVFDQISIEVL